MEKTLAGGRHRSARNGADTLIVNSTEVAIMEKQRTTMRRK